MLGAGVGWLAGSSAASNEMSAAAGRGSGWTAFGCAGNPPPPLLLLLACAAAAVPPPDRRRCCMKARKGASPVPGPTMMMGVWASGGNRKSGFFDTYTGSVSPTCARSACSFEYNIAK